MPQKNKRAEKFVYNSGFYITTNEVRVQVLHFQNPRKPPSTYKRVCIYTILTLNRGKVFSGIPSHCNLKNVFTFPK